MVKSVKRIKQGEKHLTDHLEDYKKADIVFREIRKDSVGRSASNPIWGLVFNVRNGKLKLNSIGEGLYKEFDYDYPNASYAEKIYSIIAESVLDNTRVPNIDIVTEIPKEPSIISYKLINTEKEDMYHISDLMYYIYDRDEVSEKKNIFTIEDILKCVKEQVKDEENYKQVERSIIHTMLLDATLNNGDRHNNNWALVRNKQTNFYELAIFDHSSSLVDIIEEKSYFTSNGWVGSYIMAGEKQIGKLRVGSSGDKIIKYIANNYPEYFDEFVDIFNEKLPSIIEEIKQEKLPIDMRRLEEKLKQRNRFLRKIRDREEL